PRPAGAARRAPARRHLDLGHLGDGALLTAAAPGARGYRGRAAISVGTAGGGLTPVCYRKARMISSRRLAVVLAVLALSSLGCSTMRKIVGAPEGGDPSVLKAAETRWLLVQNPRYGDVPSEPEYIWVEEDKVPTTFKTLVRGSSSIIAPPEIVA